MFPVNEIYTLGSSRLLLTVRVAKEMNFGSPNHCD